MRVFITGTTGFIGNAVARAFSRSGHTVYGLIRTDAAAKELYAKEIIPIVGNLHEPRSYLSAAHHAEVFVHCASEMSAERASLDAHTIDAFIELAKQENLPRLFLYTSGCFMYGNTGPNVVDEGSPLQAINLVKWRPAHDQKVLEANQKNLRTVIIRPGCVYGRKGGLTAYLFESAQRGAVEMIGKGENHWSMVHIEDLASAYVCAAEKELSGIVLNVNDGTHHTVRQMAEKVAQTAGIPGKIKEISYPDALKAYGPIAEGLALDQKISNERAQRLLDWRPRHPSFLEALPRYFEAWKASL